MNVTLRTQRRNIPWLEGERAVRTCGLGSSDMRVSATVANAGVKLRLAHLPIALLCMAIGASAAFAQNRTSDDEAGLGPVVSAYLGYLRNEQEVVDDRASRREISRVYYRRNSNRIRALREMAVRIARETRNDYLPELEAVAGEELGTLFEHPPNPTSLRVGAVLNYTLRYLGLVRVGETFYLFARLDPYEQTELRQKGATLVDGQGLSAPPQKPIEEKTRPRRLRSPRYR